MLTYFCGRMDGLPIASVRTQAINCCREVRALLSCSADLAEPCLGYEGDCSLLPSQFSASNGFAVPDDYVCRQFPDGENGLHVFILGLILAAVAVPFKVVIEELLAQGNEARAWRERTQAGQCAWQEERGLRVLPCGGCLLALRAAACAGWVN